MNNQRESSKLVWRDLERDLEMWDLVNPIKVTATYILDVWLRFFVFFYGDPELSRRVSGQNAVYTAGQIACLSQANSYWQKRQIHTSIHTHRQFRVSFIWPACLWTVGGNDRRSRKHIQTDWEHTNTKRGKLWKNIFEMCHLVHLYYSFSLFSLAASE